LSRKLYEALNEAIGMSDKIDPALLLSSATDFTNLNDVLSDTTVSQDLSEISEIPTTKKEAVNAATHRNGRTHNPRKRARPSDAAIDALNETLQKKWKEDKDEREERERKEIERERKEEERSNHDEVRQDELINIMKSVAEAFQSIAKAS